MRGVCSIVLDTDKAFIAFAGLRGARLISCQELEMPAPYKTKDILSWLRENTEILKAKIIAVEKKHLLRIERIFLQLPWNAFDIIKVQEDIPLKRRKKIASGDIAFAKRYLENKVLDWDDHCMHDIASRYEVEGKYYRFAPLGISTRKININLLLIRVKDRIYREVESIFDNLDRNFGGFIAPQIGIFSSAFTKKDRARAVVSIDYDKSYLVVLGGQDFITGKEFSFGLQQLIGELGKRFILPFHLAEEVFVRYFSFKETPFFKEVTIKKEEGYMNLSIQTLNSFIKDYLKTQIQSIVQEVAQMNTSPEFLMSFIGRLNSKEGFYGFLNSFISYSLKAPIQKSALSSSCGCLRYGVNPFLENDHKRRVSLIQYISGVYKEYF